MIYISMFTNDVIYGEAIKKLIASLEKYKLKSKIYEIENRGSWHLNTDQKAEIILRAMEDFPDDDIVWIDADAEVIEKPVLFDTFNCEIAYYFWQDHKELRSGTMFIKNNYKMKRFISSWIKLNQSNDIWEQRNLQFILQNNPVKTTYLPISYCLIYDNQFDKELLKNDKPVIVHYEVSRKAKVLLNRDLKQPQIQRINNVILTGNVKIKIGQGG